MASQSKRLLVYIAGPLYTPYERSYLEQIDNICQKLGFTTYLPHRDAGLAEPHTLKKIFQKDLEALKSAKLVVAVLNGATVDDGTAWEIGYSYSLGIPIFGVLDDIRVQDPLLSINLMISLSCKKIVHSLDDLEKSLKDFISTQLEG
jgi:nucleoside 2-deoxyribosyltransferase